MSEQRTKEPNITCPRCRFRHPASRSCAEAKRLADEARAAREEAARRHEEWLTEQSMVSQRTSNPLVQRLKDGTKVTCGWPGEDVIDPLLYEAAAEIERRCDEIASLQQEVASLTRTLEAAREASGNIAASNLRLRDETERLKLERSAFVAALERIRDYDGRTTKNWPGSSEVARAALRPADETPAQPKHAADCDLRLYGNDPGVVIECTCGAEKTSDG